MVDGVWSWDGEGGMGKRMNQGIGLLICCPLLSLVSQLTTSVVLLLISLHHLSGSARQYDCTLLLALSSALRISELTIPTIDFQMLENATTGQDWLQWGERRRQVTSYTPIPLVGPLVDQVGDGWPLMTHASSGTGREMEPVLADTPTGMTMNQTTSAKEEMEEEQMMSAFRCSGYSTGNGTMLYARNPAPASSVKRLHLLQQRTPLSGDNEGTCCYPWTHQLNNSSTFKL